MPRRRDAVDATPRRPDAVDACRDCICTTQEEDKIALDDPDFWEKTLGKDALKQKKEVIDTTQRKAKQGFGFEKEQYGYDYGGQF